MPIAELLQVFAIWLAALLLRSIPAYRHVFADGFVRFLGADSWYHLRMVDYLVENFPHSPAHDAYLAHPVAPPITVSPLFDQVVAGIALVIGLGEPSAHLVEVVAA